MQANFERFVSKIDRRCLLIKRVVENSTNTSFFQYGLDNKPMLVSGLEMTPEIVMIPPDFAPYSDQNLLTFKILSNLKNWPVDLKVVYLCKSETRACDG